MSPLLEEVCARLSPSRANDLRQHEVSKLGYKLQALMGLSDEALEHAVGQLKLGVPWREVVPWEKAFPGSIEKTSKDLVSPGLPPHPQPSTASDTITRQEEATASPPFLLVVEPRFRDLIPPLNGEERALLEASVIADGCRDPLEYAEIDGVAVQLDGFHRRQICEVHGIPYAVRRVPNVSTPEQAEAYMVQKQLGRRNISGDGAAYLRGRLYHAMKAQGARSDLKTSDQTDQKSTAEAIGNTHGVSSGTVRRDAAYATALDGLGGDIRNRVLGGALKLTRVDVEKLAENEDRERLREELLRDGDPSVLPWKKPPAKKTAGGTEATATGRASDTSEPRPADGGANEQASRNPVPPAPASVQARCAAALGNAVEVLLELVATTGRPDEDRFFEVVADLNELWAELRHLH